MLNEGKSRQVLLSVLGVAILVVAVVGISYAAFTVTGTQSTNTISTATITMSYAQPENGIYINNALPTLDANGMQLDGCDGPTNCNVFDFTVSAVTTAPVVIPYTISITEVAGNNIPVDMVKVYLTAGDTQVVAPTLVTNLANYAARANSRVLYTGDDATFNLTAGNLNQSVNYRLRMWLDSSYVPPVGTAQTFKILVNVDGSATPLA